MSALSSRLVAWLNGTGYAPGHPIVDDDFRTELALGTLLNIAATLSGTDTGEGADLIGVPDANNYFTGDNLSEVLDELYLAATTANADTFVDAGGFYALDQVGAAFAALATALGGTSSTVRNYTNGAGTRLVDNDSFFTALDKLDQGFVALLAVTNGNGASLVGLEDLATWYATLNVEGALAELATAIGGTNSTTRNYATNNYVADNDTLVVAIEKLDAGTAAVATLAALLTRETAGAGAKLDLFESTGSGVQKVTMQAPAVLTGDRTITVPDADVALADVALNTTHRTSSGDDHSNTLLVAEDGVIPVPALDFTVNPTDGDTIDIGPDTYEFVDPLVNTVINNDARIAVVIAAAVADTRVNLQNAVNGIGTAGATITLADGVTPALEDGTQNVVASFDAAELNIKPTASAPGGVAIVANPNLALGATLTSTKEWNLGNMNAGGGAPRGHRAASRAKIAITTDMIAHGTYKFEVQHAVESFSWQAFSATNVPKDGGAGAGISDTLAVAGGVFTLTLNGAGTDLANTDYIVVESWGASA